MTRVYYKDAQGCIIMFDLTNRNSFLNTLKWKKDVDSKCSLRDGTPIPCMLLANKVNSSVFLLEISYNLNYELCAFQIIEKFLIWK